jgi:hypothetical protein
MPAFEAASIPWLSLVADQPHPTWDRSARPHDAATSSASPPSFTTIQVKSPKLCSATLSRRAAQQDRPVLRARDDGDAGAVPAQRACRRGALQVRVRPGA